LLNDAHFAALAVEVSFQSFPRNHSLQSFLALPTIGLWRCKQHLPSHNA